MLSAEQDPEVVQRYRRTLEGLVGIPATEGNRVDVLRNGEEIFPAMLQAIEQAAVTVDLLSYIYWAGDIAVRFAEALAARARAGVRVRVLLDAVGAARMNRDLVHALEDAGCDVRWFRPPTTWKLWEVDHRTHRKVLVCDEAVAFTGGVGIAEEWEGDARTPEEWRDTHFRVLGPAVDGLRAAFVSNWREAGGELFDQRDRFPEQPEAGGCVVQVVRCSAQVGLTDLATVFFSLLRRAQRQVRISTAYFVPDDGLTAELVAARERGVAVDIIVPGPHPHTRIVQIAGEGEYGPLLDAGVRIWRYQPTMMHAKVMTVDGVVACVGSGNMDERSMRLNDEANLVVFDSPTVAVLDAHFDEDLAVSELVDPEGWDERGLAQRAEEAVVDVFDQKL